MLLALFEIGRNEGLKRECEKRWDRSLEPASLGGGVVRGLLKAGCGAGNKWYHYHRHKRW
jgi:hypothetical protein